MYQQQSDDSAAATFTGCGAMITLFITNILLGGWSVVYLSGIFLHTQISWLGAILIGLFVGQLSVPVAIVSWLWFAFT